MTSPPVIPTDDYEAIEAAVMDTARGRWFLAEFARRNRTADTQLLLQAIERLENQLGQRDPLDAPAEPKPHEPVTSTALVSSATSELFAVEPPPHPHRLSTIPSAGLADDGDVTWIVDEADTGPARAAPSYVEPEEPEPPAEIHEIDDAADLIWPASAPAEPLVTAPPAPALPPEEEAPPAAPPALPRTPQSAMLASALAQAEQAVGQSADPEPAPPPGGGTPSAADPAELDALSFEEKSVYFA